MSELIPKSHEVTIINFIKQRDLYRDAYLKLREGLEFYGNEFNWGTFKEDRLCRLDLVIKDDKDSCGEIVDDERENILVCIGGKRARLAIKEADEILNNEAVKGIK